MANITPVNPIVSLNSSIDFTLNNPPGGTITWSSTASSVTLTPTTGTVTTASLGAPGAAGDSVTITASWTGGSASTTLTIAPAYALARKNVLIYSPDGTCYLVTYDSTDKIVTTAVPNQPDVLTDVGASANIGAFAPASTVINTPPVPRYITCVVANMKSTNYSDG